MTTLLHDWFVLAILGMFLMQWLCIGLLMWRVGWLEKQGDAQGLSLDAVTRAVVLWERWFEENDRLSNDVPPRPAERRVRDHRA